MTMCEILITYCHRHAHICSRKIPLWTKSSSLGQNMNHCSCAIAQPFTHIFSPAMLLSWGQQAPLSSCRGTLHYLLMQSFSSVLQARTVTLEASVPGSDPRIEPTSFTARVVPSTAPYGLRLFTDPVWKEDMPTEGSDGSLQHILKQPAGEKVCISRHTAKLMSTALHRQTPMNIMLIRVNYRLCIVIKPRLARYECFISHSCIDVSLVALPTRL